MANTNSQTATFRIGEELFGIGINKIKEIVRYPRITHVPRAPYYLNGLANLRGNVLPVIDARSRLGLEKADITDSTRVLILDTGISTAGVIVDSVKGVISMENTNVEAPPPILSSGVDVKYVQSVIKTANGEKMILELDVDALCAITVDTSASLSSAKTSDYNQTVKTAAKEIQLVTFLTAGEEYGFPIESVREVLRVERITEVPEAPDYVMGIFCIRNTLLPVIDIRKLFDISSYIDDIQDEIVSLEKEHNYWLDSYRHAVESQTSFGGILNADKNETGRWIESFRTSSELIAKVIQDIRFINQKQMLKAREIIANYHLNSRAETMAVYEKEIVTISNQILLKFSELKEAIKKEIREDQRVLVVEINKMPVGILVDRMQQVIRILESNIDPPPTILGSCDQTENLNGIVKLNEGKRLILLLDENHLLSDIKMKELDDMTVNKKADDVEVKREENLLKDEEIQLVTFRLGQEEFGLQIEEVQEINRLENITSVPRVPEFVEGVINLRGNVIPAIDLRKRFGMELREHDEATRVIIVNINNKLTGLIVDSVSEVLRMSKQAIEAPPDILSADFQTEFIKGIGKMDQNERMIILIEVSRILSTDEQQALNSETGGNARKTIKNTEEQLETKPALAENSSKVTPEKEDFSPENSIPPVPHKLKKVR